jgi:outer membrane receptor protein involved in Fe transport
MFIPAVRARLRSIALAAPLVAAAVATAAGEETPPPPAADVLLAPVIVTAPPPVAASSELLIPGKDFELLPQGRPADVLRLVPGLILSQHQGGGKSEQYLLRGFDADHGTDVALFVDGMPVNLRTHAHGQGYADLHFLIPETIKQVDAFKGPYYVEFGDFATAGAIDFVTLDVVPENLVQAAGGSFGTQRYLTLLSPTRDRLKTLVALEGYTSDGPFDRAQDYKRLNVFTKASATLGDGVDGSIWTSYLRSSWFGSGQIPERAVRSGLIDRFGSIDDSEGGRTERASVNAQIRWKPNDADLVTVRSWGQYYSLDLFSDFTFFLDDPVNRDGIEQTDRDRLVAGLDARYEHRDTVAGVPVLAMAGVQYRLDRARVILAHQADRHLLERTQDVNFVEQSFSPMVKFDLSPLPWLRFVTGARGDIFHYEVRNNLGGSPDRLDGDRTRAVPSVKANLVLGPWRETEFFANFGTGFHSNDARAVVLDPRTPALPQARGYEFGVRSKIVPRVEVSATYWVLDLKSELVFAGDDGTTEARGPSHRQGWEIVTKARLLEWLVWSGNVTLTDSAFDNGQAIPLAPRMTARADLTARLPGGLAASASMRYVGDRYADESRGQTARGYTLFDVSARYRYKDLEAFLSIENLANSEWREAQFFFESRLPGEPATGVPDIHFTPGNPRTFIGGLALRF